MPGLTFIDLPGSTCAMLTSAEACYLPINLDGGNATSSDSEISSTTDMSSSGTYKGVQINFFPRITSSGLPGGTGASLARHVGAKAFITEDFVKTRNGAFADFQISPATNVSCSETTRGIQIHFTAGQTSSKLAGGTGATLTRHVDVTAVIPKDSVWTAEGTCSNLQIS
eukprot:SAG31_NODE_18337_length_640_cov_0.706100_1_plen_168_part_10